MNENPALSGALERLSVPQRQSPLAVIFMAFKALRRMGLAQLIFIGFAVTTQARRLGGLIAVLPIIALFAIGLGYWSWRRHTFTVLDGELRVTKGLLSEQRLSIPLDRIQSVSVSEPLLQRLLGLVSLSVDTAGTLATEFEIHAVRGAVAADLQVVARNIEERAETVVPGTDERVVIRHSPERLVRSALCRLPAAGFVVLATLPAVGQQLAELVGLDRPVFGGSAEPDLPTWLIIVLAVLLPVVVLAIGTALNLVRELVVNWDLTLLSSRHGVHRSAGLTARTSTSSTLARIQRVSTAQNPLEARFGFQRIALETVGVRGGIKLPGCNAAETADVEELVFGLAPLEIASPTSSAEILRSVRNAAVVVLVAMAVGWFSVGWPVFLGVLVVAVRWLVVRRQVTRRRWGCDGESLGLSDTLVTTHTERALLHKANSVQITQSRFERGRGLATVEVAFAGPSISIGMISIEEASRVRDLALFAAETDPRPWM